MKLKSKTPNVTDFYEESPSGITKEMQNNSEETVIDKKKYSQESIPQTKTYALELEERSSNKLK